MKRFFRGVGYPFQALIWVVGHPSVLVWFMIPLLINAVIAYLAWVWTGVYIRELLASTVQHTGFWYELLYKLGSVAGFVVRIVVTALSVAVVGNIAVIPFNDFLSEKVDRLSGKWSPIDDEFSLGRFLRHLAVVVVQEIKRMAVFVAVILTLFVLSFIPLVGIVTVPLKILATLYFLAVDNVSYALERRGQILFAAKAGFVRQYLPECLGLGAILTLFLLTPLVNFIFLPVGAVAGTLLCGEMLPPTLRHSSAETQVSKPEGLGITE